MADHPSRSRSGRFARLIAGLFTVAAACFAVFVALVTDAIRSTDESYSHGTPLLAAQFVVATLGMVPACLFARALVRGSDARAKLWLVIGIVVFLAWGVLYNAAM